MPRVALGDTVRLNDHGLEQCFGHTHGLKHMKTLEMTITEVEPESLTYPEQTFGVSVDDDEINSYMIDDWCFDVVRKA